tara:strand:+ start:1868 stop:2206 length:339 start_codon:yes stop_codon:yes gene_type:complete
MNKYLYFGKGTGADASGKAIMIPLSSVTGISQPLDDEIRVGFKKMKTGAFSTDIDTVTMVNPVGAAYNAMKQIANACHSNEKNPFTIIFDGDNGAWDTSTSFNYISSLAISV